MIPSRHSGPQPNITGSPAGQSTVPRLYPPHFPDGEVETLSQSVLLPRAVHGPLMTIHKEAQACFSEGFQEAYVAHGSPHRTCGAARIWIPHEPDQCLTPCRPGHASLQLCHLCSSLSPLIPALGPHRLQFLPNHPPLATEAQGSPQVGPVSTAVGWQDGWGETQPRRTLTHGSSGPITAGPRDKPS